MIDPQLYTNLISQYSTYFSCPPMLDLDFDPITRCTKVSIDFYFIPHPIFSNTRLRVREWYDSNDNLDRYRYCWEINRKPSGNISAWENEHNHSLPTDPHHHHYVPYDRHQVQPNYNTRNITDAFNFVMPYIISGNPYP